MSRASRKRRARNRRSIAKLVKHVKQIMLRDPRAAGRVFVIDGAGNEYSPERLMLQGQAKWGTSMFRTMFQTHARELQLVERFRRYMALT